MGLVKGKAVGTEDKAEPTEQQSREELVAALEDSDATVRRHAAQKLMSAAMPQRRW
jgi:hypothetical protein